MPCATRARSFAALVAAALLACAHARSQPAAAEPETAPTATVANREQASESPKSDPATAHEQERAPKSAAAELAEAAVGTVVYSAVLILTGGIVILAVEYPLAAAAVAGGLGVWAYVESKSSDAPAAPSVEQSQSSPSDAPSPPKR